MSEIWYALCECKNRGRKKIPYQIQASQYREKLEDKMERLQEQNPYKEYVVITTLEMDELQK